MLWASADRERSFTVWIVDKAAIKDYFDGKNRALSPSSISLYSCSVSTLK
jgi:hypothetical protein